MLESQGIGGRGQQVHSNWKAMKGFGGLGQCLTLLDNSVLLTYLHAWKYLLVELKSKDLGTSFKYCYIYLSLVR